MANFKDYEALNDSIRYLGGTFAQRREQQSHHDEEMARLATEQQFRQEQLQRLQNIESKQSDNADKQNNRLDAAAAEQKKRDSMKVLAGMMTDLHKGAQDGTYNPDVAWQVGKSMVSKIPADMQNEPEVQPFVAMYSGEHNIYQAPNPGGRGKPDSAPVNIDKQIEALRKAAKESTDPKEQADLTARADLLQKAILKYSEFAPKPNADTTIDRDAGGLETGRHTRYSIPPPPSEPASPPVDASGAVNQFMNQPAPFGGLPSLPGDTMATPPSPLGSPALTSPTAPQTNEPVPSIGQRVTGKTYKLPKGNFQWTGTGWLPAQ